MQQISHELWFRKTYLQLQMNSNSLEKEALDTTAGVNFSHFLPVVEQYVRAFNVSVKEVVFMAVVQTLHQLAHEAADVLMGELDQA